MIYKMRKIAHAHIKKGPRLWKLTKYKVGNAKFIYIDIYKLT